MQELLFQLQATPQLGQLTTAAQAGKLFAVLSVSTIQLMLNVNCLQMQDATLCPSVSQDTRHARGDRSHGEGLATASPDDEEDNADDSEGQKDGLIESMLLIATLNYLVGTKLCLLLFVWATSPGATGVKDTQQAKVFVHSFCPCL